MLNIIHDKLQPLGLSSSQTLISFHSAFDRQLPVSGQMIEDEEDE
jgi:Lrp/AsnC family transcriptional regulator for asnA, asnC and gidA